MRGEEVLRFLNGLDDETVKNLLNSVSFRDSMEYDKYTFLKESDKNDLTRKYKTYCMPKKGLFDRLVRDKEYGRSDWCGQFEGVVERYKSAPGDFSEQVPGPSPEEQATAARAEEAWRAQQQEALARRFGGEMQ